MMTGRTLIDGKDLWTAYGAFVTEGGYRGLVQFPSMKAVEYNDWQEEDGIEADLSNPVLDMKSVQIPFAFIGSVPDLLLSALSDKGYHEWTFNEVGRAFTLRLVSAGTPVVAWNMRLLTLTFSDDLPLDMETFVRGDLPSPSRSDGYLLDGTDLSSYGVRILEGTRAELEKSPSVKPAMLRNISSVPGTVYDGDARVTYATKDITLHCLIRAGSLEQFWTLHDTLLYDLMRPQERQLTVTALERDYDCFYKSMSVQEFIPVGGVWMKFALTLTVNRGDGIERPSCYATGRWIGYGTWDMEDKWKDSPDAA